MYILHYLSKLSVVIPCDLVISLLAEIQLYVPQKTNVRI